MTVIIGLETETGVLIGADSAAAGGCDIYATRLQKVFQRGPFLIGYTDSFRMGQILQYQLSVEPQDIEIDCLISDLEYLSTMFVDAVRACLESGGYKRTESGQEEGGRFLVGYRGKLYYVGSDFQINAAVDGYMAIGCGSDLALGAMWVNDCAKAHHRVKQALRAAAHFNSAVCEPFCILEASK